MTRRGKEGRSTQEKGGVGEKEDEEREPGWGCVSLVKLYAGTQPRLLRLGVKRGADHVFSYSLGEGWGKKATFLSRLIPTWPDLLLRALRSHAETHTVPPQPPNTSHSNPRHELR